MNSADDRTRILIGEEGVKKLSESHVAIFGIGGVGGAASEAIARAGVGTITIVDADDVEESNINRQAVASYDTIGRAKTDVMAEKIVSVSPECVLHAKKEFFAPEVAGSYDFSQYDYVLDCVDTVSAKISIIENCAKEGIPVISAMGAGNKLNPGAFEVEYIENTSVCPLAKIMRTELKKRGISHIKCVYSKEAPVTNERPPGSISFVPPVMGMIMAGEAIKDLINLDD